MQKSDLRFGLLVATLLLLVPNGWAFDPTYVIHTVPPVGRPGTIAASGSFAVELGAKVEKMELIALNQDETEPGASKQLMDGVDFSAVNGTWNASLPAKKGLYEIYVTLHIVRPNGTKVVYNTPRSVLVAVK